MSAVERVIAERKAAGSGALVGYLPVGFPDLATSIDAAVALAENGVDVIELGLPYSDPVMDGTAIQRATQAALAGGFRLAHGFEAVAAITARVSAPVLVMTYWNPVLQYGIDRFADDLLAVGGAGLITPDLVPDEAAEWVAVSDRTGLDRVFLAAPS
ncbi:MAG: tryptophan synthase alpha chain, partial [Microbacteriaceae bacterium]|nr:tryptophan synthase alpha chain [Microbacteriaceae bacterium]